MSRSEILINTRHIIKNDQWYVICLIIWVNHQHWREDRVCCINLSDIHDLSTTLQNNFHNTEAWCNKWKVEINADKSVTILFTRLQDEPFDILSIDERPITWINNATYLELILDKGHKFNEHLSHFNRKAKVIIGRGLLVIGHFGFALLFRIISEMTEYVRI